MRHGESLDTIEDRYGGYANYDLTEKGRGQAKVLSEVLHKSNVRFDVIFSSPYLRAYQTAEALSSKLSVPLNVEMDIRERNTYGYLSGMKKDEAKKMFEVDCVNADDYYLADNIDGAENVGDTLERVVRFLKMVTKSEFEKVAIVTHGKVVTAINLMYIKKKSLNLGIVSIGWLILN